MAEVATVTETCDLILPRPLADRLFAHLFPGDGDEHGAVIAAGVARSPRGFRLLAREVHLAADGVDYVPGERGYRMLRAEFVRDRVLYCRDEELAYLAVHNHGGTSSVAFSPDDMMSHERGYPALLDVIRGQPVGGLVFARDAVAGDIWLPSRRRLEIREARVVGPGSHRLHPSPPTRPVGSALAYDRQARLFGDAGQDILRRTKVGIIGAGGMGLLLVEYLARLGVGWIVVVDPERINITNLPRLPDATRFHARTFLTARRRSGLPREFGERFAKKKVSLARRIARRANPDCRVEALYGDFVQDPVAQRFTDCDFLFLAADFMQARLVFNALVHQYLIPGFQCGSKALVDKVTGHINQVFSVNRPVFPDSGCLWCNGLISPDRLQQEAATARERRAQRYVDEPEVRAPSVITLNALSASHAANDFMFAVTDLTDPEAGREYMRFLPRSRDVSFDIPRADPNCSECGMGGASRFARGDSVSLPTK